MLLANDRGKLKRLIAEEFQGKSIKGRELKDWFLREKLDRGFAFGYITGAELIILALNVGIKITDTKLKAGLEPKISEENKISKRNPKELNDIFTKGLLVDLHINKEMSPYEIGKMYDVHQDVIVRRLKKYGIKQGKRKRNNAESKRILQGAC